MLFSMFSPIKKEDKQFQLLVVELIEILVRIGTKETLDTAEKFGNYYLELEKKINTHDYTKEDIDYDKLKDLLSGKLC